MPAILALLTSIPSPFPSTATVAEVALGSIVAAQALAPLAPPCWREVDSPTARRERSVLLTFSHHDAYNQRYRLKCPLRSCLSTVYGGFLKSMLRIRLRRVGAKKRPSYRIVIADSKSPRDGAFLEVVGTYDPMQDPPAIRLDEEKALHWLRQGAQPSEPVARILTKLSLTERVKASEGTD
ncbi:MAG: ribosomal protein [Dehalococcoidia bacterium]|nr:ribosomal protein [Dehalococcoidia bacterium]